MAYQWLLVVRVDFEEVAKDFAASFDLTPFQVAGHTVNLSTEIADLEHCIQVTVTPTLVSGEHVSVLAKPNSKELIPPLMGVAKSPEHAEILTGIGKVLYDRLLWATAFDAAILGTVDYSDGDSCIGGDFEELIQELQDNWTEEGLVLSDELWAEAMGPGDFTRRSDGTYWIPWTGVQFLE